MNIHVGLVRIRLLWALFGITGLVLQGIATELAQPGSFTHFSPTVNFFSFFTILMNLCVTLWFLLAFRSRQMGQPRWWGDAPEVKGALLVAGTVTVLVYWTLLVDIPIPNVPGEVGNFFVHLLVPLGLWVDWLLAGDPMTKSYGRMLGAWVIFPIVYVIYTELRGPFAHWYPYFFLNPQAVGGVGNLLLAILGMILLFLMVATLIYWLYRKRGSVQLVPARSSVLPQTKVSS